MAIKVLVLGGSGMLGAMVTDFLSRISDLQITSTVRAEPLLAECQQALPSVVWSLFDAQELDVAKIERVLVGQAWVINAIGVIKPYIHDDNAQEVERAIRINAIFPHLLARAAGNAGARVLQIATDCVYSGQQGHYVEQDKHDASDAYGKTKSLGEVISSNVHHLRCSIIGPEPKAHVSLLDWFLGQPQGAKLNGFANHRWNGVTTLHYAKLCCGIITRELALPHLQHIIPTGDITKCDLLKRFSETYRRPDITVNSAEAAIVVDRTLETKNNELNKEIWAAAGHGHPPSVPQMVEEMASYNCALANRS